MVTLGAKSLITRSEAALGGGGCPLKTSAMSKCLAMFSKSGKMQDRLDTVVYHDEMLAKSTFLGDTLRCNAAP